MKKITGHEILWDSLSLSEYKKYQQEEIRARSFHCLSTPVFLKIRLQLFCLRITCDIWFKIQVPRSDPIASESVSLEAYELFLWNPKCCKGSIEMQSLRITHLPTLRWNNSLWVRCKFAERWQEELELLKEPRPEKITYFLLGLFSYLWGNDEVWKGVIINTHTWI